MPSAMVGTSIITSSPAPDVQDGSACHALDDALGIIICRHPCALQRGGWQAKLLFRFQAKPDYSAQA